MLRSGIAVALLHLAIGLAGQEHAQVDDVGVVEVEIRHQLLDVLGLVDARGLEFVERPVIPRLGNVGLVAEKQFVEMLGAKSRQLDADARLLVHPFDLVASEASVLAHERFARLDIRGILERGIDAGVFFLLAVRHQERGQRFGFVIAQPQRRHRSMR